MAAVKRLFGIRTRTSPLPLPLSAAVKPAFDPLYETMRTVLSPSDPTSRFQTVVAAPPKVGSYWNGKALEGGLNLGVGDCWRFPVSEIDRIKPSRERNGLLLSWLLSRKNSR